MSAHILLQSRSSRGSKDNVTNEGESRKPALKTLTGDAFERRLEPYLNNVDERTDPTKPKFSTQNTNPNNDTMASPTNNSSAGNVMDGDAMDDDVGTDPATACFICLTWGAGLDPTPQPGESHLMRLIRMTQRMCEALNQQYGLDGHAEDPYSRYFASVAAASLNWIELVAAADLLGSDAERQAIAQLNASFEVQLFRGR
ncbi:hypothetical protein VP1G_05842 [Cytospora mali]|uniref:Uncharacterized protein n=1 Tax=Cytospora mali TaxID=578113 RepID=A0A194V3Q6_CYTMA|nr:hypothetical protein VP1G_05842 [Valsa mali var. pyri (nom. inval.)]